MTVLEFCVREAVTPRDVAATVQRVKVTIPDSYFEVADQIAANLSLNCMVHAYRPLW